MKTWKTEELLKAVGQAAPGECVTEERMVELIGRTAKSVKESCFTLRRLGFLEKTAKGCHKLTRAGRIALDTGETGLRSGPKGQYSRARERKGTLRERAWHAIRLKRKFSLADLYMLCAQGGERDIRSNFGKYVRALAAGGYLQQLKQRDTSGTRPCHGYVRWLLLEDMDHGPLAPVYRHSHGTIWDPNIERSFPTSKQGAAPGAATSEAGL